MTKKKKLLIVDDNPINRAVLSQILLSGNYAVLEAGSGDEALTVLEKHKDTISLILLDIIMPIMDGYTFLSIVKSNPEYYSIPIIVTTQKDGESDEINALSRGASDFVTKPYKPEVILHRIAGIINLKETEAMINLVKFDKTTGIYSKEYFFQRTKEILENNPYKEFDLICSDIKDFKLINDILGNAGGDRLLKSIAETYKKFTEGRGICCRFNADQFICLIEHRTDYDDKMFFEALSIIYDQAGIKNFDIKWGIYYIDNHKLPVEQMCHRALTASRNITGKSGKFYAEYDNNLRKKLLRHQEIIGSMETALNENQFELYLQPKYRVSDNKLSGAEVLVRWNHPILGHILPDEFIPIFEHNGFITKMDIYIWKRSCAEIKCWNSKGYNLIPISLNISRADIYKTNLVETLSRITQTYDLSPSQLQLEFTESSYAENPNQIINIVSHLRKLGYIIAIDNFGSGYSSLNMLNQMPFDILNLDISLIKAENVRLPSDKGMLKFIIELAHWLNLNVVAKGVETEEQFQHLCEIGCDHVQGYYFSKPVPCKEFDKILQQDAEKNAN